MAHVIGWSRQDLEAPQAVDTSPGAMLHPVHLANSHWSRQHQPMPASSPGVDHEGGQGKEDCQPTTTPAYPKSLDPATTLPVQMKPAPHSGGPRILGLRRTTFFLTASNLLLAIGLIVLGVVQSRVLHNGQRGSSPGLEAQASCSR